MRQETQWTTIFWEGWTALALCAAAVFWPGSAALGYPAVCACEPVAWMLCMIFILAAAYAFKNDLQDVWEERT